MKRGSTLFARVVVYLVGFAALTVCFILLPELAREEMVGKPASADITLPFLTTAYILAMPFFIALYQTLKLLHLIENNNAFSDKSIRVLQNIKMCAIVFSVMIIVAVVGWISFLRSMGPTEDMPPFFLMGLIITFVSIIIAVFVAVLQKLLADAVKMKSENDLIV